MVFFLSLFSPENTFKGKFFLINKKNWCPEYIWCSIFLPNLVKKVNIAYSTCNLVLNSLNYTQLYRYVYFFCFQLEKPFFVKFGPRKENYLFKMKFDIKTNSNMLNQILMFIFSILYWKYFFSGKYNPKHFLGT